jgi:hypothetical protein
MPVRGHEQHIAPPRIEAKGAVVVVSMGYFSGVAV